MDRDELPTINGGLIMKVTIEIKDGLVGYQFKKGKDRVQFEDLSRWEQISILNSFANGYELFINALKKD